MPAKTILLAMFHESGHLNPTFKLAKSLRARGHDVRYLAIPDVAPQLHAQGFDVVPLMPDLFPPGVLAEEQRLPTLEARRRITRRYLAVLEQLRTRSPLEGSGCTPQLMLVDVTQPHLALWARRQELPLLYVNTSLPQTKDPGVPPLRSAEPYGPEGLARLRSELAWARFLLKRRLGAQLVRPLGMEPPYEIARRAASRFDLPRDTLDARTVYMPQLAGVPELVLCPAAFDFPRPERPERHHVESIDLGRKEPPIEPLSLPTDKPLVYCAFGGQRYRTEDKRRFFARLLQVLREHPGFHLLLSLGRHIHPSELAPCPPNVTLVESAPQLAVLKRAQAMITHGGLGSVKECILGGVPMLVVPLDVDQPGNAARVVHHGLGLTADVRRTRAPELGALLERVMFEQSFRDRGRVMQARFRVVEQAQLGADVVEALLPASPV